jgi:hypothetical protein
MSSSILDDADVRKALAKKHENMMERISLMVNYLIVILFLVFVWVGSFILVGVGFWLSLEGFSDAGIICILAGLASNYISIGFLWRFAEAFDKKIAQLRRRA